MSKHTPGPWEAVADPGHFHTLSTVHGGPVKTGAGPSQPLIVQVGGMARPDEQSANTRLIAAAPEMLATLEYLLTRLESIEDIRIAQDAITKAKGETE